MCSYINRVGNMFSHGCNYWNYFSTAHWFMHSPDGRSTKLNCVPACWWLVRHSKREQNGKVVRSCCPLRFDWRVLIIIFILTSKRWRQWDNCRVKVSAVRMLLEEDRSDYNSHKNKRKTKKTTKEAEALCLPVARLSASLALRRHTFDSNTLTKPHVLSSTLTLIFACFKRVM